MSHASSPLRKLRLRRRRRYNAGMTSVSLRARIAVWKYLAPRVRRRGKKRMHSLHSRLSSRRSGAISQSLR
ncbi:hypothetical protein LG3211_4979 [Lysobacter gummosus]|nr:hypothetical protein LG3211_4979 [Lysobacter gummosus]